MQTVITDPTQSQADPAEARFSHNVRRQMMAARPLHTQQRRKPSFKHGDIVICQGWDAGPCADEKGGLHFEPHVRTGVVHWKFLDTALPRSPKT